MSHEEYDSDCSIASDYGILKKALPFEATIPDNFDPKKIPQTAEEFLQYACYERSQMKSWTTAEIDPSKLTPVKLSQFEEDTLTNSVDPRHLPTQEWQSQKLEEFREFRNAIQPHMTVTGADVTDTKTVNKLLCDSPDNVDCLKFSQADKIRVLESLNIFLESLTPGTCFNDDIGTWIYAMLSLLDLPLLSDDCHVVRSLAKKCIELRSNFKATDSKDYYPFNLIICIVSKFFGQLDLSDL